MELLQLTYFCHAAVSENFSHTAQAFLVPPSNVSRAIRLLEREVGVKLFRRSSNRVELNECGLAFFAHASRALEELEKGKLAVGNVGEIRGELRVLVSSCRRIVTEAIEECKRRYPEIRFTVRHGVDNGNYDFVISDAYPARGGYEKLELMRERILLAIPNGSPLCDSEHPLEELASEHFITLGEGTRLHSLTEQVCRELGFIPKISIQIDDPYYMRKYLEMGLGVALYPEKSWATLHPERVVLRDVGLPERKMHAFFSRDAKKDPASAVFLEILKDTFSKASLPQT